MAGRHALLIGVPQCDDGRFSDIDDVVRSDVHRVGTALEQSGYVVTAFGLDGGKDEPTLTRIRRRIRTACEQVPSGGVLLVYFSGHGVSADGRDYLVPSDADASDTDTLVPVVPADLTGCKARLVVFFVDACRDDPAREPGPAGGHVPFPAEGSFVLVTGCEAGQRCHYTETGSVFTQALAQVLDRRHPARTLGQVVDEVTQEVRRRAARNEDLRQSPGVRHPSMLAEAKDVVICEGDELAGAWGRAVRDSGLWGRCGQDEHGLEAVRQQVLTLVERCARRCRDSYEALRRRTGIEEDPWFDRNYPVRVLEGAALLLGDRPLLTPAEAALLVAAPFLREVVIAEGVRLAATVAPTDYTRTYQDGARTDLELTHEMHQQMVRRAEGLARRDLVEQGNALAMWLVHQWLATRQSVWQSAAADDCHRGGARLLSGHARGMAPGELPKLVEVLLRAVGAGPADSLVLDGLSAPYMDDRWRSVAALLWLGGILAADLRRMPPVLADHIGTRMELSLPTVKNAAERLRWVRRGDVLDLQMSCHHPAQHAAFQDVVTRAAEARRSIAGLSLDEEVSAALPAGFGDKGLRPETRSDGTRAFEVPLSRFRLAEDKVRELLMGRQLYDDPALSIRELYQNALDACRYRDIRLRGLRALKKETGEWSGRIRFRQGTDENGREYVECEDNGVGMDIDTLKQVFAAAGERFVYKESFRSEQAAWQTLDPPLQLVSNSQFGVGVFSYFMLADEITVVTRPVDKNGNVAGTAHCVDIASSGSLFQITSVDDQLRHGGTRVRLYLTPEEDESVSVLTTMRKLLWISDFHVEVAADGSATEVWEPRELRYQDEAAESLKHGEDLWWVSGEGGLAADGIRTNEKVFGLIVNLRDARRPQFTVDRKKLRKWDKEWVRDRIEESLPALVEWPGLTVSWLWQVAESAPEVAQQIFEYLVEEDVRLRIGISWGQSTDVPVRKVGCLPADRKLYDLADRNAYFSRWFGAWRAGQWEPLVVSKANVREHAIASASDGFPVVDPIDAKLLDKLSHQLWDNPVSVDNMLLALAHPDQTAAERLRRLRRYSITGLDLGHLRECPSIPVTCEDEDDVPLFRALAAWSPPGGPPRRNVAGWLVAASSAMDKSLGEVLHRAARLAPADWIPPDLDLGDLAGYTCTNAEVTLLSVKVNGGPPWIEGPLTPAHVMQASAALGREVDQVLTLCDRLAPLGVTVAGRDRYPGGLTSMEVEALRQVYTLGEHLTPLALLLIAGRAGDTFHRVHEGLESLEDKGFLRRPDIGGLPDALPGPEEVRFIETNLMRMFLYQFPFVGSKTPPFIAIATYSHGPRVSQRTAATARALIPFCGPDGPVTPAELTEMARQMFCSIGEARKALLAAFPDADVPDVAPGCHELTPFFEIGSALVGQEGRWRERPVWLLQPAQIVEGAIAFNRSLGGFLAMLAPYRGIGAPVPELDETTAKRLDEIFPDEYDEDMLVAYDRDERPIALSEFDPLLLVRTAGRLGWPAWEAHRRLERLEPIGVVLAYPVDACPGDVVRWQDLLLLTEHLDGYAPAISGRVTRDHVQRAAEETGETAAWIVERLRLYAPLFALDLEDVVA
ncbi:caspase family protein [Actinomadura graeca]|uniref:Caspase family protein n=1 Tax=Actinomadura graeca TaxID=2750812 RepID=A0ABX8QVV6_9ACTN|nr:caspase family protein [Actinomadura graeca]QXJ22964.1 caspase family protein [Actinomadura graeca]